MHTLVVLLSAASLSLLGQRPDNPAVDAIFADLATPGSPGCALGVNRDGKLIYAKGYGLASIENQVPITPGSVFDIGSTSKQFTAASILLLERQGKLKLDDDVRKWIPELPNYAEQGGRVSILHLLHHTSGIRDYVTLFALAGMSLDTVTTDETALAIIARQKALNFPPGSEFLYSNSGYFLLSVLVKRVSGKPLREFAQENIFAPLGMIHTQIRDDHRSLIPNRAAAYDPTRKGGFQLAVSYFEQTGDGAVHTTVEDLLKWDENFYSAQVGGREFLLRMQERGRLTNDKLLDYAMGLFVSTRRGLSMVDHGGAWRGYRAQLIRFPEQHFSVACLCNLATANAIGRAEKVAEVFLANQMKAKESPPAPAAPVASLEPQPDVAALAAYAGEYASQELGVVYRITLSDGRLIRMAVLENGGFPRVAGSAALRATAVDQFVSQGVTFVFTRGSQGHATGFSAIAGRAKGILFTRVSNDAGK